MEEEHPYQSLPSKAYWKQVVAERNCLEIEGWYAKKWPITQSRISSAGSCFAQHIGRYLRDFGFNFLDVEPPPPGLVKACWAEYGYGLYSARYGNIYTPRQLLQLLLRATGELKPVEDVWGFEGGYVDPFRPALERAPFSSPEEVEAMRKSHLQAVLKLFEQTDVFIFTLGLTEAWVSKDEGLVFPLCPGVRGGKFDSLKYRFRNFSFAAVKTDLEEFVSRVRSINNNIKFIFTVSPVPLVATASGEQVVVATTYSKSVLRGVAGLLAEKYSYVDYFPSYEIIASPVMKGIFYEPDMRSVTSSGVQHVMKCFFGQHHPPRKTRARDRPEEGKLSDDLVCEELLLQSFGDLRL